MQVNSATPIHFETAIFKGCMQVRIKDCPGAPQTDYFQGKARTIQMAVQGQFKKELPMDTVFTGEEVCVCE